LQLSNYLDNYLHKISVSYFYLDYYLEYILFFILNKKGIIFFKYLLCVMSLIYTDVEFKIFKKNIKIEKLAIKS